MPRHRPPTSGRQLARLLALLLLLAPVGGSAASPTGAPAQRCGAEREPNDVEAEIQPQTGLFCVAGTLANGGRDLFLWTVDAETAARSVVLAVSGVPTTVTTARLLSISSRPGVEPVVAGSLLLSVTANPGDAGPVTGEALIDAGSCNVKVSRAGTADGAAPPGEG